ncbi:MAG: KH domain RNA binding protein YlqC, partial [uncultured Nocardioides sp.]
ARGRSRAPGARHRRQPRRGLRARQADAPRRHPGGPGAPRRPREGDRPQRPHRHGVPHGRLGPRGSGRGTGRLRGHRPPPL